MASISAIVEFCTIELAAERFRDAAVNGLQVEGAATVQRLATAVSVNEHIIRGAIEWGAEALLVHHGLLWGERQSPITGPLRIRLSLLLSNNINLVAYHLPLDAHAVHGNNAALARLLQLAIVEPFAEVNGQPIGFIAQAPAETNLAELTERVQALTGRAPQLLTGGPERITRVAIVSGSGYATLDEAAALGCQALVTGDVREPTMALARELGVSVIAGGHEATERCGVQALAAALTQKFDVEARFFPDPNPI